MSLKGRGPDKHHTRIYDTVKTRMQQKGVNKVQSFCFLHGQLFKYNVCSNTDLRWYLLVFPFKLEKFNAGRYSVFYSWNILLAFNNVCCAEAAARHTHRAACFLEASVSPFCRFLHHNAE